MGGIDRLISTSLSKEIKKGLKLDVLKSIERELFLEHGMSIKLAIEHFDKFSNILKKQSQINVSKFERDCINKIIKVKKKDNDFIITIINQDLSNLILESFSDMETRKIISKLLENELTIPKILKESKVPKTSGYRKIENMILSGLIIESGKILSESKKISKLQCVFHEIKLDIKKDKTIVTGIISKKIFSKSSSIKTILQSFE